MPAGRIRFDDATPLHVQIRSLVRSSIESMEHPPGTRLPPERTLAEMYGVSRITVRQALDALAREGLVRRGRGRAGGTFVQEQHGTADRPKVVGSFGALYSSREIERVDVLAFARRAASGDVSAALAIAPGTEVRYVERVFVAPRGPLAHVRSFVLLPAGDRLQRAELRSMMLHETLLRRHRLKILEARDEIEAALADSVAARLLDVELGRALVRVRRTLVGPRDRPLALSLMLIATHRYQLVIRHPAPRE